MPGYDLAKSDQDRLASEYKCMSCVRLLRETMQTSCGHLYCLSCLDSLVDQVGLRLGAHVPILKCLDEDETMLHAHDEVFPDNFMRREIMELVVQCMYVEFGCMWEGEVRHLEIHTKNCEFLQVSCRYPECGMLVKKSTLQEHFAKCQYRPPKCVHCNKEVNLNQMQVHHDDDCPAYPTVCPKCNKGGIPHAKMAEHQDTLMRDCDRVQGPCPFYEMGCSERKMAEHQDTLMGDCVRVQGPCPFSEMGCSERKVMSQSERQQHLKQHAVRHVSLLLKTALNLSRDVELLLCRNPGLVSRSPSFVNDYENVISDILTRVQSLVGEHREVKETVRKLNERVTTLERHVVAVGIPAGSSLPCSDESTGSGSPSSLCASAGMQEKKTADHEVLLVESNRNVDELRQQVNSLVRQFESAQETSRRLERKVESHEHVLAIRNVALADLEEFVRQQQVSSYDGALLWKIDDYARRKNDAVTGRQSSFYSACFYTSRHGYKMCARIYLNGEGMGKGSHVSVFFVVMRGQFDAVLRWPFRQKVTIMLLDQDNVEHVIDAFRPDPNSSSFQRPRREMNMASGCPLFCPLADLSKHAYVRDDVMFMKIIVDTSDL